MEKQEMRVLAARVFNRSIDDFCEWAAGIVTEQCPALDAELRRMSVITKFGQAFAAIQRHGQEKFISLHLSGEARKRGVSVFGLNKWINLPEKWILEEKEEGE